MPIRKHLSEAAVFEPAAIAAMSKALEETCARLGVAPDDQPGREFIATRVIELASNGLTDPDALRDQVMRESQAVA